MRVGAALLLAVTMTSCVSAAPQVQRLTRSVDDSAAPGTTVEAVSSPRYRASGIEALFTGTGYRELWAAPIQVPVANLAELGGGITPLRVGGGSTTHTLHVEGADGRRYVFRTVDKTPGRWLPEEYRGTAVEWFLQDQTASFHPSGALVLARLLDEVDVLHAHPVLMVLPDDPRLGEYREQFAGLLVLFEERPDEGPEGTPGFAGSDRVVGTPTLIERLEEPEDHVDAEEFLRARLVDMVVADRDRGANQWRWARFPEGDRYRWRPIPRDRDQAFVQLDGVLKRTARIWEHTLVGFDPTYSSVQGLTRTAWDLDRRFLARISSERWWEIVAEVRAKLSDSAIEEAARELPKTHHALAGESLVETLKSRRDRLEQAAGEFYQVVFREAEVAASGRDDEALIERMDGGRVRVRVMDRSETAAGAVRFDRTFDPQETSEVRIYLQDGDDVGRIEGDGQDQIKVRIIGGSGRDRVEGTEGAGRNVLFYDGGRRSSLDGSLGARHIDRTPDRPTLWINDELRPDFGSRFVPRPTVAIDSDLGLFLSAGFSSTRYGFMKQPFSSRVNASAAYSPGKDRFRLQYRHELTDVVGGADFEFDVRWSDADILNFFGLGNETPRDQPGDFFRVEQRSVVARTGLSLGSSRASVGVGPVLKVVSEDLGVGTILDTGDFYGSGQFNQLGADVLIDFDSRDGTVVPNRGVLLDAGFTYYPSLLDVQSSFALARASASGYWSPSASEDLTLALRMGGQKNLGTAPFHESAFVGGQSTVRGLDSHRFAGDAAVFGSAEARFFFDEFFFFFPAEVGVFGLGDVGRVFLDGESSDRWHKAAGGGLMFALLGRQTVFTFSLVRSSERTAFYIGGGLGF